MSPETRSAQQYFEKVPAQWDALYSHENPWKYYLNRVLRKGLFDRYDFAFRECGDLRGKVVLDIGSGTGRFSIECAKRGAAHVVGVDFAPSMIEFSQRIAREMGVDGRCTFIAEDVLSHSFDQRFDVVLAMGLFDYVEHPERLFAKIGRMSPGKVIASFPRFTRLWAVQRHVRYQWIRKCPIYYYSREQIERLCRDAGFSRVHLEQMRTGFVVCASRA
jgi:cyclopropane fatty-acyl-phospholipid synthase-like methyltransferase